MLYDASSRQPQAAPSLDCIASRESHDFSTNLTPLYYDVLMTVDTSHESLAAIGNLSHALTAVKLSLS